MNHVVHTSSQHLVWPGKRESHPNFTFCAKKGAGCACKEESPLELRKEKTRTNGGRELSRLNVDLDVPTFCENGFTRVVLVLSWKAND